MDSYCKPEPAATTLSGSCVLTPLEGEPCPDNICAPGLGCVADTCRALPGLHDTCYGSDDVCAPGLYCMVSGSEIADYANGGDFPQAFECQPLIPNGGQTLHAENCESGLYQLTFPSVIGTCTACGSTADCVQGDVADSLLVSVDSYSGFCEWGVCHDGLGMRLPGSKPFGAACFDPAECRSLNCPEGPDTSLNTCGEPDLEALFCIESLSE